jgi:hypothetical protein
MIDNRGGAAATSVTGWLHFDSFHLVPLSYFSDFSDPTLTVVELGRAEYTVQVGGNQNGALLPTPRDQVHPLHSHHYAISVAIVSESLPATTQVGYDFITPSGESLRGTETIDLSRNRYRTQNDTADA